MGYTHYWYRDKVVEQGEYDVIVDGFKKVAGLLEELGVNLADGRGRNEAVIDNTQVCFNGKKDCGHAQRELGITWPADNAHSTGIALATETWFAGVLLETRSCGGDCSHETFYFPVAMEYDTWIEREQKHFQFCKTAFKPYDLAVTAFLVIAKHHLGDRLKVASDGDEQQWQDAKTLCQRVLGYGEEFSLDH